MKCCEIENIARIGIFTDEEISSYVEKVLRGKITVNSLDEALYFRMSRKMSESIQEGFGNKASTLKEGSEERKLLEDLIRSGYYFNAAKQYQLVMQIRSLPKENIIEEAESLFRLFNIDYFSTELDSAFYQAKSARSWLEFVAWDKEE